MRGGVELSLQINLKAFTLQKLFVMMAIAAMFSTAGLSVAYAQTPETHNGQGQQFSQHGNSTGHQHTGGSYSGTFSRNGTAHGMNSFNHTKTEYPRDNNVTSSAHMPTPGSSSGAVTSNTASSTTSSFMG